MARERFRVYDANCPGDRYTIVDSRPTEVCGQTVRFYFGMSAYPYHPQGIGMHGEFSQRDWRALQAARFRNLGKRIKITDLPTDALRAAEQFIRDQEGTES